MKIIEIKKTAQFAPPAPSRTMPVQQEGGLDQPVSPGATAQPAARPGANVDPIGGEMGTGGAPTNAPQANPALSPNGPQVEPSDPDAEMEAEEGHLFPMRGNSGSGNAAPDVYPASGTPAATPSAGPAVQPPPTAMPSVKPPAAPGMVQPFKRSLV